MLHRYAFSNFQSFRERTEVSWVLDGKVPSGVWSDHAPTGERISRVMAVVGANASGKTSLLKPLLFLNWFISHSFSDPHQGLMPFQPHLAAMDTPSEFELEVDFEGKLWRYVLRTTPQRVLHEALYVKQVRMGYVFVRDWNESAQNYDVKQQGFGLAASEARKVRPNASLIATAAQYGVELAQRLSAGMVYSNIHQFGRQVNDPGQLIQAATYFSQQGEQMKQAIALLKSWDLGLKDIQIREIETLQADGSNSKFWLPFGIHASGPEKHFELPFVLESNGTQSALVLLSKLLPALAGGGLAVIDEFESDLHPLMLEPLMELFASPRTNPHKAQLLFTCHAVEVLNLVHKSQVTLVEKDEHNQSTAWRLDSVGGVRNDDNLYAKYMAGAYGAVPQL